MAIPFWQTLVFQFHSRRPFSASLRLSPWASPLTTLLYYHILAIVMRRLFPFRPILHTPKSRFATSTGSRKNPHADWYAQILPAMLPIALLGSTVYIALHLLQTHLSSERHAAEDKARIDALERQLDTLRQQQNRSLATNQTANHSSPQSVARLLPRDTWYY